MPLANYGVLKGDLFTPAEQSYQGEWFHGIFFLNLPEIALPRRCVTDFSSANKNLIQYRIFTNLNQSLFQTILALPDGYTALASNSQSGALDYVRSPILASGQQAAAAQASSRHHHQNPPVTPPGWILSDGSVAVQQLQAQLSSNPTKLFVFGEPFTDPTPQTDNGVQSKNGMHNVHMNQGDPATSSDGTDHQLDDGIWQDGATVFINSDGTLTAFCSKFVSQTFNTNDQGLPV